MTNDIILDVMLMLKNNWSLTGDLAGSSLRFDTRLYDENILFPQVVVTPQGGDISPPIDMGSSEATYPDRQILGIDVYVRPKQDSISSLGWAKNAIYEIRKECDRIIQSGSTFDTLTNDFETSDFDSDDFTWDTVLSDNDVFLFLRGWERRDDLTKRPPILRSLGVIYAIKYIKGT